MEPTRAQVLDTLSKLPSTQEGLADALGILRHYPYEYALWAFPWDSGPLRGIKGPEGWQSEVLQEIGIQVRNNAFDGINAVDPILVLISSGHGIGKSTEASLLANWIKDTRPFCRCTVTANTRDQLKRRTFAEIVKWARMSPAQHMFDIYGESISHKKHGNDWAIGAQTCNEENSESFAGQHARTSTSAYIFDEASKVPPKIWEVAYGGLTDGEPMLFAFGNPTQNSGEFYQILRGRKKSYFFVKTVDSREVSFSNKTQIQRWSKEYGEDSDFFRVRVRGLPPKSGSSNIIPEIHVEEAMKRVLDPTSYKHELKIMGVDPAGEGEDRHSIVMRQGLKLDVLLNTPHIPHETSGLITRIMALENEHNPAMWFIDKHGLGGPIIRSLRTLGLKHIIEVNSNDRFFPETDTYLNSNMWMWKLMRDWFKLGPDIPDDEKIMEDFTGPSEVLIEAGKDIGKYRVESKQEMRTRGLQSPGVADATKMTFYREVKNTKLHNRTLVRDEYSGKLRLKQKKKGEYNIMDYWER